MELIEREALIKAIENDCPEQAIYTKKDAIECVLCMPTIDPIRAAGGCRCRECSFGRKPHAEDMQDGYVYCQEQSKYMSDEDFCSGGELREGAQEDE